MSIFTSPTTWRTVFPNTAQQPWSNSHSAPAVSPAPQDTPKPSGLQHCWPPPSCRGGSSLPTSPDFWAEKWCYETTKCSSICEPMPCFSRWEMRNDLELNHGAEHNSFLTGLTGKIIDTGFAKCVAAVLGHLQFPHSWLTWVTKWWPSCVQNHIHVRLNNQGMPREARWLSLVLTRGVP